MKGQVVKVALGGQDDRLKFADGSLFLLRNVEQDTEGSWQDVAGTLQITSFGAGGVTALHWFEPAGNQRWLLAERRIDAETSEIVFVDWMKVGGARGTATQITTRRRLDSLPLGTQFYDFGRWCYFLSPVDTLVRWDGSRLSPVGFITPPAPPRVAGQNQKFTGYDKAGGTYPAASGFASKSTQRGVGPYAGGTNLFPWLHGYAMTVINDADQESPPSEVSYASGTNGAEGRLLAKITSDRQGQTIKGIRLWRSINLIGIENPGSAVDLFLLAEFTTNGPIDFIDHFPDGELGPALARETLGVIPVGARTMAFWQGHMWLAGMPGEPNRIRYSAALYNEQFPAAHYLSVGSSATGSIVKLIPVQRGMLVLCEDGIFMVKGDPLTGYRVETITELEGCGAPQAVENLSGVGVFFLNQSGPRVLIGSLNDDQPTKVVPVGQQIQRFWRRRVGPNLRGARVVFDPGRNELWFAVPESGDPDPKNGIVFHATTGLWSVRQNWSIGALEHYRGRTFLGSHTESGIYVMSRGTRQRFGTDIAPVLQINPVESPEARHLHRIELNAVATGGSVTAETRVDRALTRKAGGTRELLPPRHYPPRWGESLWSTSEIWTDYEPTPIPMSVTSEVGRSHEVRLTFGRFKLLELALMFGDTRGPQTLERT